MTSTAAYLDQQAGTLAVINPRGKTLRTLSVPAGILASHAARQAAWARNTLRNVGFTPDERTVRPYPYGIEIPLTSE